MLLQELFSLIETMLSALNFVLNVNKCVCIRIGHRFDRNCVSNKSQSGATLSWVSEIKKKLGCIYCKRRRHHTLQDKIQIAGFQQPECAGTYDQGRKARRFCGGDGKRGPGDTGYRSLTILNYKFLNVEFGTCMI